MLNILWLAWQAIAVYVLVRAAMKQFRSTPSLPLRITVKNIGEGTVQLIEVRNVTTGKVKNVDFTLEPGYSKTVEVTS